MVIERATGRYNLRPRKVAAESTSSRPRAASSSGERRRGRQPRRKRGEDVMGEVEVTVELTPKKRSIDVAELEEGGQTRKRQRSPDDLPPTPQSEPVRSFPIQPETIPEIGTIPPLSEIPAQEVDTPSLLRQMADAAAQTESFETPIFPRQVPNAFTTPPYYPEMPAVQESYIGVEQHVNADGHNESTSAVDMTAGPLYDAEITPYTPWPQLPIAPTILPAGDNSTEMGYMGPGALEGPFQYQESAERLYRPSEAQFDFARNLQRTIAVESPQNEPLTLLAGVANNLNEQAISFPDVPVPEQTLGAAPEEDLDLTEIVPNLFVGSSFVFVPEKFERFCSLGIGRIFMIGTDDEMKNEWDAKVMETIHRSGDFYRETIPISDEPTSNLLGYLRNMCKDLEALVNNGRLTSVHCKMGRSASAAVIVAYLMKAENMSLNQAYDRLRELRPQVKINPGFVRQLKVWDVIKDDFDNRREYPEYKLWKINREAGVIADYDDGLKSWSVTSLIKGPIQRNMFKFKAKFPRRATPKSTPDLRFPHLAQQEKSHIRCYSCKYPLAPGDAIVSFSRTHNPYGETCSHFLLAKPMHWMNFDSMSPGGKIQCPNPDCQTFLGEYCWLGVQCLCGEISSPGVALFTKIPGTMDIGTEFKMVREEGDDFDDLPLSQEDEEDGDEEDEDEEDEDEEDEDEEEEDQGDESQWEDGSTPASDELADQENIPYLTTVITPISPPTQAQLLQRRLEYNSRKRKRPLPPITPVSPRPRNASNLPAEPSPLRETWIPRSAPSSANSSQNGDPEHAGGLGTVREEEGADFEWEEYLARNADFVAALDKFEQGA